MDIFKYLKDDGEAIAHRLNETVAEFAQWPQDRLFEESKKAFASLEAHFEKEKMIVNNINDSDLIVPLSEKAGAQIKDMKEAIDSIIMIHIDEPGYLNALKNLAVKMNEHLRFCLEEYYPALAAGLSANDKENVNSQFENMVLS